LIGIKETIYIRPQYISYTAVTT